MMKDPSIYLNPRLDAGSSYRCAGFIDSGPDRTGFITAGTFGNSSRRDSSTSSWNQARADSSHERQQNNMPPKRTSAAIVRATAVAAAAPITTAAVEQLIEAKVSAALANHEALRNSTNSHGDGSHNYDIGIRGTVHTPRECTYNDFLNCKPLTFKGTEGVVVLSQWFEKMKSVFHINNCAVENQVKFATCTFLGNALSWWNSHMKTVTQDVAYAMD
ncbi:hypothetical protein Tco_1282948 [Tanacetum coccineum]